MELENPSFIDDYFIHTSIYREFSHVWLAEGISIHIPSIFHEFSTHISDDIPLIYLLCLVSTKNN